MRLSRRRFLIGGSAAGAAAALAGTALGRPQAFSGATPIAVTADPIGHLSARDPDRSRFGSLAFRSGLDLKSPASEFGGFSALWRSNDGRDIIALADNAQWLKARVETSDGRLSGLSGAVMAPLVLSGGKPLRQSRYYDTESLALSGNAAFVGVERHHAVIRFERDRDGAFVRGVPIPAPKELQDLPKNGGLEALGIAPAGSPLAGALVAVAERPKGGEEDTPTQGFILTGPRRGIFRVVRSGGYDISDLAFLPNGDLLLLDRRVSLLGGFGCRLRRVEAKAIRPEARVDGEIVFESDASQRIDNMEGLAVHRDGHDTVLTLISDDNFNHLLQRTLLLEFALVG